MSILATKILGIGTIPDDDGMVVPGGNDLSNNLPISNGRVIQFVHGSTRTGVAGRFTIPSFYYSTPRILVEYSSPTTGGNFVFDFEYRVVSGNDAQSLDPSALNESLSVTAAAPTSVNNKTWATFTLDSSNMVAGATVLFKFYRDQTDASDSNAGTLKLYDLYFQFDDGGMIGATGLAGAPGSQGPAGDPGSQGSTGVQGSQGATGFGLRGDTGLAGATGLSGGGTGLPGVTGLQGLPGSQGSQGTTGLIGSTGLQGPGGSQGSQGQTGPIGPSGSQGVTGTQGIQGSQGTTGLGITGPRGLTGLQGTGGAQGATGAGGGGDTGLRGTTGLQGATGLLGPSGSTGATGSQGNTGIQGIQGTAGSAGSTGATGTQGLTGIQGIQGTQGNQGTTGVGFTGLQGTAGNQGSTGLQGNSGSTGIQGIQGAGSSATGSFSIVIGDGFNTITGPNLVDIELPFPLKIESWRMMNVEGQTGLLELSIRKSSPSVGFPTGQMHAGVTGPFLAASDIYSRTSSASNWSSPTGAYGDSIRVYVEQSSGIKRAVLLLRYSK